MTEETIWTGTSSQVKNFWIFVACILVIPIPWAIWRWLKIKNRIYTLTTERLTIRSGVLNKATETLELYRVRDLQITEPLWQRMWGLKTLMLITSDSTTPQLVLDYLPTAEHLGDKFRHQIEVCRQRRRIREFGVDVDPGGDYQADAQIE